MSFPSSPNYFLMQQWKECLCLNLTRENYQHHKQSHKQSSQEPGQCSKLEQATLEQAQSGCKWIPPPQRHWVTPWKKEICGILRGPHLCRSPHSGP